VPLDLPSPIPEVGVMVVPLFDMFASHGDKVIIAVITVALLAFYLWRSRRRR